ncbi:MAG: APC family permease, partial [Gammaproteobacteria bacterium]
MIPIPELKRTLSFPLVTFYGLGTILGAGIYVLIGSVAGVAGYFLPIAFLGAALIAGFTAFSYAELVSRLPRSAGEAMYVATAFGHRPLTIAVGYASAAVGIISAATIASGFAGYLDRFIVLDSRLVVTVVVVGLALIAALGIRSAAWTATLMTVVEIAGLVLIIVLGGERLLRAESVDMMRYIPREPDDWRGIGAGAFLAFYAFLGFEDMVNVAEEVRDPSRNLPRAIIAALLCSTVLYLAIGFVAVTAITPIVLAASAAPLTTVAEAFSVPARLMSAIAVIAITNGALIQMIKSSRIIFGLARLGEAPAMFTRVGARTGTPLMA